MKLRTEIILIVLVAFFFHGCAGLRKNSANQKKNEEIKKIDTGAFNLQNFDKKKVPNDAPVISKMIGTVQPELSIKNRNTYAKFIKEKAAKYKVEPQIMVALIDTESNFIADKVSSTGDISIAQVNVEVWNKEFERMKMPLIEKKKLLENDQAYAIETMTHILSILKERFSKNDRHWYARYHSNTSKYKKEYLKRIEDRIKLLNRNYNYILAKI